MAKLRQLPLVIGALIFLSCMRGPAPIANYGRNGDGCADKWKYKSLQTVTQYTFDTNFDSHPDLIKTYRNNDLIKSSAIATAMAVSILLKSTSTENSSAWYGTHNFDGKRENDQHLCNGKLRYR